MTEASPAICRAAFVAALLVPACSSSHSKTDTNHSGGKPTDEGKAAASASSIAGSYQCTLERAKKEESALCDLRLEGQALYFSMPLHSGALEGQAKITEYGFRFQGSFVGTPESVAADFFTQGPGAYASVLQLEDTTLIKLTLERQNP